MNKQIITISEAKIVSKKLHEQGKKIVVAGGCFDLLHIGHITLLENAKKQGDFLFVLLESDESIKKRKGTNRPIHNQKERAHMISLIKPIDFIVLLPKEMSNDEYDELLKTIHPEIIATTQDDPYLFHKQRQAEKIGAMVKQVNTYIPSVSTTKLLETLSKEL